MAADAASIAKTMVTGKNTTKQGGSFGWFSSPKKDEKKSTHAVLTEDQADQIHRYWKNYNLNESTAPELMAQKEFEAMDKLRSVLSKVIVQYRCRKLVKDKKDGARDKAAILVQKNARRFLAQRAFNQKLGELQQIKQQLIAFQEFKEKLATEGFQVVVLTYNGAQRKKVLTVNTKDMTLRWKAKVKNPKGWSFPLRRIRPNKHKGVYRGFEIPAELKDRTKIKWPETGNTVTLVAKDKSKKTTDTVTFVFEDPTKSREFERNFIKLNEEINGKHAVRFDPDSGVPIRIGPQQIFFSKKEEPTGEQEEPKQNIIKKFLSIRKKKKSHNKEGEEERKQSVSEIDSTRDSLSERQSETSNATGRHSHRSSWNASQTASQGGYPKRQSFNEMAGSITDRESVRESVLEAEMDILARVNALDTPKSAEAKPEDIQVGFSEEDELHEKSVDSRSNSQVSSYPASVASSHPASILHNSQQVGKSNHSSDHRSPTISKDSYLNGQPQGSTRPSQKETTGYSATESVSSGSSDSDYSGSGSEYSGSESDYSGSSGSESSSGSEYDSDEDSDSSISYSSDASSDSRTH